MPTFRGDPDAILAALAKRPGCDGIIAAGVRLDGPAALPPIVATAPKRREPPRDIRTDAPRRLLIEATVPIRLASEPNAGGKLGARLGRKGDVKTAVRAALPGLAEPMPLPVTVTLTRHGVRPLDDDNLQGAFKAVRDVVAQWIGVDDADRRVRWKYRQRPAWTPSVMIRIEHDAKHTHQRGSR